MLAAFLILVLAGLFGVLGVFCIVKAVLAISERNNDGR